MNCTQKGKRGEIIRKQSLELLEAAGDKGRSVALEVPRNSASEVLAGPEL